MSTYSHALALIGSDEHRPLLTQLQRGIEKEGLRCSAQGVISQKPHPHALGATLTHPAITTDYSESLLEFITPVFNHAHEAQAYLEMAHRFAYQHLDGELIWPSSMPCLLQGEMSVPIAQYGKSNLGQLKHIYRHGLWHRYGRMMQCIAGIHYNFSLPKALWPVLQSADPRGHEYSEQDYISARYFGLIRNFRRYSWLLLYLFGASPAVCTSFLAGREHRLQSLSDHTLYAPYATSLRMSDLGYQNNAQSTLKVCHNSLDNYVKTLSQAVTQSVPAYEAIGVQDEDGHYKQLNTNLLQIENEYYSDIRPKRVARNGEKPLQALAQLGVEYVEVRCTDVNPFLPVGINIEQMHFLDVFLTWCLLQDSPDIDAAEVERIANNHSKTVMEGRRPDLTLQSNHGDIRLQQWGLTLLTEMEGLAKEMDRAHQHCFHADALSQQRLKLADSNLTPSAMVLRALKEQSLEFNQLTLRQAEQHRKTLSEPLSARAVQQWKEMAQQSWHDIEELERNDTQPFAQYLEEFVRR